MSWLVFAVGIAAFVASQYYVREARRWYREAKEEFGNAKRAYRLARKHENNAIEYFRHTRALLEEHQP